MRRIVHVLACDRRGVTLPELLTAISIIATLASTATVSYGTVREYGRDLRRVGDMSTLQGALELYYQNHYTYPADTAPGSGGLVLGLVLVAIGAIGSRLGIDPATVRDAQEGVRGEGAAVVSALTAPAPE